jgi:hypothetical protein
MRKVLRVMATTAVGMTLLSCAAPPQPGNSAAIGFGIDGFDIGAIVGSVLASTEAYVLPPPRRVVYGPPRRMRKSYSDRSYPRSKTSPVAAHGPRPDPTLSKTVKAEVLAGAVEQKSEAKFKAAQAKAQRDGVETLTQKDIEGLSLEQIKQLRGY